MSNFRRLSLRNLTVGKKFALICSLFAIPATVALLFALSSATQDIASARLEIAGNTFQRPLERLLDALPQHQALVYRKKALKENVDGELATVQTQIDTGLQELQRVYVKLGGILEFTDAGLEKRKRQTSPVENLTQDWAKMKQSVANLSAEESNKEHAHMINDLRMMITHSGDTSTLILDPELDSFYLVDASLVNLPQVQDHLGVVRLFVWQSMANKSLTIADRTEMAVQASLLNSDHDRVVADLQTSVNEDATFHGTSVTLQQRLPEATREFSAAMTEVIALMRKAADGPAGAVSSHELAAKIAKAREASFRTWDVSSAELEKLLEARIVDLSNARLLGAIATMLALLAASLTAWFMSRMLVQPIQETVKALEAVAQGDFTQELLVRSTDETGRMAAALNGAVSQIRDALTQVQSSAESVANAAQELTAASSQLASGAQRQAASLEETAASLEEITATVRQSANNAKQASQLSDESRESAESGGAVVASAVDAMTDIRTASERIAEVVVTIDGFAFQTNLLALNAAVEAARAGDKGRGFAVVAAEVRNLALSSAKAAKEIKALVQDSVEKVAKGSTLVNDSGQTLKGIVGSVRGLAGYVSEISAASQEQASGIEQVNRAVTHMDKVTQSNSAQTEQLTATANSLSQEADHLKQLTARFVLR